MKALSPRASRIVVALLAATFACGLAPGAAGAARFIVRSWQSEHGLPSSIVRALAQAADGYLWVATAEGVVRFDGVRFSRFPHEADAVLAQRPPRALFALPGGEVWVATQRGGLLHWDGERLRAVWDDVDAGGATGLLVTQVASDGAGGALIERGEEVYHAVGGAAPGRLEKTPALVEKLRAAVAAQWQRAVTAPPGAPLELLDTRHRQWVRTPEGGLAVSDSGGEFEAVVLPEIAPGSRVAALLEDRESNLWVATNGNGLFQVRTPRVSVIDTSDGLSDRTILALLEDRAGALWAGNKSGGIDRLRDGKVTHFSIGSDDATRPISALCEDREGTLWVARRSSAVFRWRDGAFQLASGPALPVGRVAAMVADAEGRLWFGGERGLAAWKDETLTQYGPEHGLPAREITALAVGPAGELWVGLADGGLFHGKAGHFNLAAPLAPRVISALLPEADGAVWVTTLGAGLFRWKDGRADRFSAAQGLPDDRLTCVLPDDAGNLWMGSLAGIFRVARAELAEIMAQRRETAEWVQFDRADGMLARECTGGFQPAGWRGRDGTLWFPTVNGIASVRPATVELNPLRPPVMIEEARAQGRAPQSGRAELRAGPGRSRLEFRYTALSFTAPEKVHFRTQLEGLEDQWSDAGPRRTVAYEAVPPGRYRFRVVATNGDGLWTEPGVALAVVVAPHFWETLWFRIAVVALAVAVAFGIGALISRARWRGRMLRLEAQTSRVQERARIAQDLHDDLGASLTEISMLSQLAAEDENRERRRDPLPEIAAKAHRLVSALDEIVWAVNPRHDTLPSLVDYLAAFAAELLDAAGIALRLDLPRELPAQSLDAEQRHGLFLAVREALNNAVKHSAAREVWLRLSVGTELQISVEDNGHGFTTEAAAHREGLRNMRERLARLGGSCAIASSPDGTRVTFAFPLGGGGGA